MKSETDKGISSKEKKWLIRLSVAIIVMATLVVFTVAKHSATEKPRSLLTDSSEKYLPSVHNLPDGFFVASDAPVDFQDGDVHSRFFTNPDFLLQGREVNVNYHILGVFDDRTIAQDAFNNLSDNVLILFDIISVEEDVSVEHKFSNSDDIKILFVHELTELDTYAIGYIMLFRYENLTAMLWVSAPVDDFNSDYAKQVKSMLSQAVLYYANMVTSKLPVPVLTNVPQPPFGAVAFEQETGVVIEQVQEIEVEQVFGEETKPALTPETEHSTTPSVILFDDFEDTQKTEQMWKTIHGNWETVNGTYFCRSTSHRCLTLAGDLGLKNYKLSLDIKGNEGVDKFLYIGFIEHERYYQLKLRSHPYNDWVLTEQLPEKGITELKITPIKNLNGYWYHIDVIVLENSLQAFVDDRLIMTASNLPHPIEGQIGIGLMYSSAMGAGITSVYFDNVKVVTYP